MIGFQQNFFIAYSLFPPLGITKTCQEIVCQCPISCWGYITGVNFDILWLYLLRVMLYYGCIKCVSCYIMVVLMCVLLYYGCIKCVSCYILVVLMCVILYSGCIKCVLYYILVVLMCVILYSGCIKCVLYYILVVLMCVILYSGCINVCYIIFWLY